KFTPRDGRIQLTLQRVNSYVEIVVSDTGAGIRSELLPSTSDRVKQGESGSTRHQGGLGIGLALVRHLVELHGGSVTAESPGEGKGATFRVKLPLVAALVEPTDDRVHPTARQAQPAYQGPSLRGLRVLVVDDDPDALDLIATILRRAEAEARLCSSPPEALAMLRSWKPHVLVSDIEMPGEDGYSLIRKVRELGGSDGGQTPAVALTAYGRPEDRVRSLSAGFRMHVAKPVDPGELRVSRGAGHLLAIGFDGTRIPDALAAQADRSGLGGIVLFTRNCPTLEIVLALTAEARRLDPDLLVLVDHEGGRVHRLPPPFT